MRIRISTTVLGLTAALSLPALAQSTSDTLRTRQDSLRADSLRADSLRLSIQRTDSMRTDSLRADSVRRANAASTTTNLTQNDSLRAGARSDRRIPVTKDRTNMTSTGDVQPTTPAPTTPAPTTPAPMPEPTPAPAPTTPPLDSAATDTSAVVQTEVTTTTDVAVVPEARGPMARPSGLYFQVGGGASIPAGDFSQAYHNGWNGMAAIGWQPAESPLGLRLMVGYNRLNGKTFGAGASRFELQDPDLWSANLNADLRVAKWGLNPFNGLYLTGGAGAYHFRNFGVNAESLGGQLGTELATDEDNTTKFGLNGGLGLSFGIGNAAMFVETRYVSIFAKRNGTNTVGGTDAALTYPNFENSTYIPLIIGFKF